MSETTEPTLTLIGPGRVIERKGRRVTIDREWEVSINGKVIGYIAYRMLTRERRTPGRTYVNARWESPGWQTQTEPWGRGLEATSKKAAIERLVRDHRDSA